MSVADYFLKVYDLKVTQPTQPMFLAKVAGKPVYLPTEFCTLDGVPDSIRNSGGMRNALAQT